MESYFIFLFFSDSDGPYPVLQDSIKEWAREMTKKPFAEVINYHLGKNLHGIKYNESSTTSESSDITFEMLK